METSHIKVIVFDLDGTLYEDTHHFDFYANCLKAKLPSEKKELFERDYQLARNNKHTVKIGRVYDVNKDLILIQIDNIVMEAFDWEGNRLPNNRIQELYSESIAMDLDNMLNIGDLWWVPSSIARHYGLTNSQTYEAFLETREYMMGHEFTMNPVEGLREVLENIKDKVNLVLLTNSPEPDSEAILTKLGLQDVFHKKIFNGQKPRLTKERFKEIKYSFNVDYNEILSIGDNWINEIRPVLPLGCSSIFIDPHNLGREHTADIVVRNIQEVILYVRKTLTPHA